MKSKLKKSILENSLNNKEVKSSTFKDKTETFIKDKKVYINYVVTKLKHLSKVVTKPFRILHFKFMQVDEELLSKKYKRNLYEILYDWVLSIAQYGIILSVILTYFNLAFTFNSVISLGLLYWFVFYTISKFKNGD